MCQQYNVTVGLTTLAYMEDEIVWALYVATIVA